MGMMINRRRVYGGKKGLLPSGYAELEYIENTSNAYIVTSITSNDIYDDGEFDVIFSTDNPSANNRFIGCHAADTYVRNLCVAIYSNHMPYCYGNTWNENPETTISKNTITNVVYKFNTRKQEIYVNGVLKSTSTFTFNSSYIIHFSLFAYVYNNSYPIKIYACTIKHLGGVILNLIPCINPQNVVGMYDTVEGKFYSSPNGTAFIAGPEV